MQLKRRTTAAAAVAVSVAAFVVAAAPATTSAGVAASAAASVTAAVRRLLPFARPLSWQPPQRPLSRPPQPMPRRPPRRLSPPVALPLSWPLPLPPSLRCRHVRRCSCRCRRHGHRRGRCCRCCCSLKRWRCHGCCISHRLCRRRCRRRGLGRRSCRCRRRGRCGCRCRCACRWRRRGRCLCLVCGVCRFRRRNRWRGRRLAGRQATSSSPPLAPPLSRRFSPRHCHPIVSGCAPAVVGAASTVVTASWRVWMLYPLHHGWSSRVAAFAFPACGRAAVTRCRRRHIDASTSAVSTCRRLRCARRPCVVAVNNSTLYRRRIPPPDSTPNYRRCRNLLCRSTVRVDARRLASATCSCRGGLPSLSRRHPVEAVARRRACQ